jgi:hypothetical protein
MIRILFILYLCFDKNFCFFGRSGELEEKLSKDFGRVSLNCFLSFEIAIDWLI